MIVIGMKVQSSCIMGRERSTEETWSTSTVALACFFRQLHKAIVQQVVSFNRGLTRAA